LSTTKSSVKARRGLARHLEGWQPGLLAIFVAGVPALLAVPRPVPPVDLPEPFLEPRELAAVARQDEALAGAAERERLDTDVRALGSRFRAYGLADMTDDASAVAAERQNVAEAAKLAKTHGDEAIARLRAYELRSFLREIRRWEATGNESKELQELGGPFLARAQKNGWTQGHRLLPDETVRAALFKKRWMELAMTRGPALELRPIEQRALDRFLLLHPPRDPSVVVGTRDKVAAQRTLQLAEQYRLKKIEELRALDPAYPADLARGIIFYRLHRYPQAVEALRKHLDDHPDGPYAVRAENYLRAALGGAMDAP
jgi:hypothetical protein